MAGAETTTRETEVKANVTATEAKYGPEAWPQIQTQILKDINITLAKLLDSNSSSSAST